MGLNSIAKEWLVATIEIGNHTQTRVILARDRDLFLTEYPNAKFREATEEDVVQADQS